MLFFLSFYFNIFLLKKQARKNELVILLSFALLFLYAAELYAGYYVLRQ